jgi:hypothetical protein
MFVSVLTGMNDVNVDAKYKMNIGVKNKGE